MNRLDVDPDGRQGHRRHANSVRVTDRAVEVRLYPKVRPAVRPVADRRVPPRPRSIRTEVGVGLVQGEPATQVVRQPVVAHQRHHLFTDAANGHALG